MTGNLNSDININDILRSSFNEAFHPLHMNNINPRFHEITEQTGRMPIDTIQHTYHGTPADNLRYFDTKRFGSANGQEFGRGIYTGDFKTGKMYADPQGKWGDPGHLYRVEIPADEYLYNVDKPFTRQSKYVRDRMINWKEIPDIAKQEWIDMLTGKANPYEEGIDVLGGFNYDDKHMKFKNIEQVLDNMGIHGKRVTTPWNDVYHILFNPKYAKIVDKLFGGLDPWTAMDMARSAGFEPEIELNSKYIFGNQKQRQQVVKNWMDKNIPSSGETVGKDGTITKQYTEKDFDGSDVQYTIHYRPDGTVLIETLI